VAGDGPEAGLLGSVVGVTMLGRLSGEAVRKEMHRSMALVVPSIWYETFGMVVIEAFACGTPVIASRIGALADIVRDGETGLLFDPGNVADLEAKLCWAGSHPAEMKRMGRAARAEYEAKYTADINYRQLMTIYDEALLTLSAH
jgi:glycosyltransferase involved in cell wall biosynthesis